jgi:phage/plasmid primase-like uncharacterized protein
MGILSYISEQKNKFNMKKEEIHQKREIAAEVRYEQQKEELANLKVKSSDLKRRRDTQNAVIREKAKIQSYAPPTAMQRISQGLQKINVGGGQRSLPGSARKNIPTSKKKIIKDNVERNSFGGRDPFG